MNDINFDLIFIFNYYDITNIYDKLYGLNQNDPLELLELRP